jgi:UDP-glucuronate 4-epimerase
MMMTTASVLPKAWSNGFVLVVLFATSNYLSLYLGMRVSSEYKYSGISNMPSLNKDCVGCNNIIASNKSSSDAIVDDADEYSTAYNLRRPQQHLHQEQRTSASPSSWSNIPILSPNNNKKVVLVTGGAGFIGSHVASALLQRGDTVIIIDNMNDYYNVSIKESNLEWVKEIAAAAAAKKTNIDSDAAEYTGGDDDENNIPNLSIYHGDINNTTLLTTIFEQQNIPITHICHLAARAGVRPSIQHPHLYIETNIMGTMNILEYARKYNVTNLVMASSSSVYGEVVVDSNNNNDNGGEEIMSFSEDFHSANTPLSPYAQTKRSVELLAYTYHALYQQMNITNLRFFTVYGPRGRPDMAPHLVISNIFRGESIQQYGDGNTSRDYTYIDDIVNGVVRSLDRSYSYQIMNVGGGSTGTTLSNFIALVEKHVGKSAKIVKKPNQMGDVSHTRANITKANMLLGYVPSVTMEEGVRRTVQWYKETYVVE